jgi:hypothetical protein
LQFPSLLGQMKRNLFVEVTLQFAPLQKRFDART